MPAKSRKPRQLKASARPFAHARHARTAGVIPHGVMLSMMEHTVAETKGVASKQAFNYIYGKGEQALKLALFERMKIPKEDRRQFSAAMGGMNFMPNERALQELAKKWGYGKTRSIIAGIKRDADVFLPFARETMNKFKEIHSSELQRLADAHATNMQACSDMFINPLVTISMGLELQLEALQKLRFNRPKKR